MEALVINVIDYELAVIYKNDFFAGHDEASAIQSTHRT
jgi:hypothetical protein